MNDSRRSAPPTPRIDGRLKVTGEARYASDTPLADPAYAFLATSAIARGRITNIDDGDSRAVPGVLDILTHRNIGDAIKPTKLFSDGGYVGSTIMPLASDQIWHGGQIVAVVLAETFEAAREAAHRLKISYAAETAFGRLRQRRRDDGRRQGRVEQATRTRRSATPPPPSPRRR